MQTDSETHDWQIESREYARQVEGRSRRYASCRRKARAKPGRSRGCLLGLGEEVGNGVEDEVDQRVLPGGHGGRHVTDDHGNRRFVRLWHAADRPLDATTRYR
jgi:hypothetical protein